MQMSMWSAELPAFYYPQVSTTEASFLDSLGETWGAEDLSGLAHALSCVCSMLESYAIVRRETPVPGHEGGADG